MTHHQNSQLANHNNETSLPNTGDNQSNSSLLVSAVATMLTGLGLMRKSRRNKKDKKDKNIDN
ncbi:hypothetical protein SKB0068_02550 [Staphylococcus hominis subsp. novobiosepticus]|nr:LPXTG cell wall anchor domain-containing protein [Staphylococcus hominis]AUJ52797.1 hypothetical protein B7P03_09450 [Staphylococcus hominis subsp. hominis]